VLLQQQIDIEHELIVGAHLDDQFGAVVVVGAGGTLVHVLDDVQLRLAPVSVATAEDMLRRLRLWPVLSGARGRSAIDVGATATTIARFSQIAAAIGADLHDLEINPLGIERVTGRPIAVDARGTVG
jgi:succinyl-CoA synthetase beta subunit